MSNPLTAPKTFPVSLSADYLRKKLDDMYAPVGFHESLLRSAQVLSLVRSLLEKKVDHDIIKQIIDLNYED